MLLCTAFATAVFFTSAGAAVDVPGLQALIQRLKNDPRGPYAAIRWYCPDGAVLPADRRCSAPGGIQHAALKPQVAVLGEKDGIFLGQILAGADFEGFLDRGRYFGRLKQYLIQGYLQGVDDGWILRKARYYRGAVQHEDESAWARDFVAYCLAEPGFSESQYYLLRQAAALLPLGGDSHRWQTIRAESALLADHYPAFGDLRVKLHGRPDPQDVARLKAFKTGHAARMPTDDAALLERLIQDLEAVYGRDQRQVLASYLKRIPRNFTSRNLLQQLLASDGERQEPGGFGPAGWGLLADLLLQLRRDLATRPQPAAAMAMLTLSIEAETVLFQETVARPAQRLDDLLVRMAILAKGCAGTGLLELWEWREASERLVVRPSSDQVDLRDLQALADEGRRSVQWGTAMVRAVFGPGVDLFASFEPLAAGFIDDRVRASLLLPLGRAVGRLQGLCADLEGSGHRLPVPVVAGGVQGLNPGFALGELRVVDRPLPGEVYSDRKIYVLRQAPADLKPVAGIATVSEGNLVSHVQLLARNLAIPNAVVSDQVFQALAPLNGRMIFYAVSPGGTVVMKPAEEMNAREKALVEQRVRKTDRVSVPVDRLDLDQDGPLALGSVGASDSGRLCGPKAANLGQLKRVFPEYVGEGVVIPFGVFRRHMDQTMPGRGDSYWQYLRQTFAETQEAAGNPSDPIRDEALILERLGVLRSAIGRMPLLPEFESRLRERFDTLLGRPLGELPVFVRSDTNMEDLKDFTGAGLNLTVFNVRDADRIVQAIRDVWASPYTERSFGWRQKFLKNPENVFPSILILPTVAVEKSGVMITAGVTGRNPTDITVAFSRGPGGAVEGQMAETYLIHEDGGHRLIAPAREPRYHVLPPTGGVSEAFASFEQPILNAGEIEQLHRLATIIRERMSGRQGIGSRGPFDVELGFFQGGIRLFQARPYVENKKAAASDYLNSLDPPPVQGRAVPLGMPL